MVMSEMAVILVIAFLFVLRFGIPLVLIVGEGLAENRWLDRHP
jgi:hypothetical protein